MLNGVCFFGCSWKDTFLLGKKACFQMNHVKGQGVHMKINPPLLKLGPIFKGAVADSFRHCNSQVHLSIAGL